MPRRTFLISVKVLVDTRGFVIRFAGAGKLGVSPAPAPGQGEGKKVEASKKLPTWFQRASNYGIETVRLRCCSLPVRLLLAALPAPRNRLTHRNEASYASRTGRRRNPPSLPQARSINPCVTRAHHAYFAIEGWLILLRSRCVLDTPQCPKAASGIAWRGHGEGMVGVWRGSDVGRVTSWYY